MKAVLNSKLRGRFQDYCKFCILEAMCNYINSCLYNFRLGSLLNIGRNRSETIPALLNGLKGNFITQIRTTFILKRRYPVRLIKQVKQPNPKVRYKAKNYVYDLVKNTETERKPDVQVVLTSHVEGLGNRGDCVSVPRNVAYNELLLTGLADYATPEIIEKAQKEKELSTKEGYYSSPHVLQTMKFLKGQVLSVVMNKETEWTLKPWHIRVSFRKAGIIVPEKCIELPKEPIKGPDLNLEMRDFIVTVTINNKEKVPVRCRLHHWSTNIADRLPVIKHFWTLEAKSVFIEQEELLSSLPLPKSPVQEKEDY